MNKAYYKEYYTLERNHWWFKARLDILEDMVRKLKGDRNRLEILNVGVATGATSLMLQRHGNVTSLEYDEDCCAFLREVVRLDVIQGSLTELPFEDQSFDLVCAFDVIEHIEDDRLAVSEIRRVLKPTGNAFITVPAFQSLWSHHDVINHHFRRYTLPQLRSVVEDNSLEIQRISYFNFLLFPAIYLFRKLANLSTKSSEQAGSGSDFEFFQKRKGINTLFFRIFKMEKKMLPWFRPPFGVSILAVGRKPGS